MIDVFNVHYRIEEKDHFSYTYPQKLNGKVAMEIKKEHRIDAAGRVTTVATIRMRQSEDNAGYFRFLKRIYGFEEDATLLRFTPETTCKKISIGFSWITRGSVERRAWFYLCDKREVDDAYKTKYDKWEEITFECRGGSDSAAADDPDIDDGLWDDWFTGNHFIRPEMQDVPSRREP